MRQVLFICCMLLAKSCQTPVYAAPRSKPVPVYIVSIDNSYARPQVRDRVMRRAIDYWRGYGIRLNRRRLERRADPFRELRDNGQATLTSFYEEFVSWNLTLKGEGKIVRNVATHVIAPAFQVNGVRYMGGWAYADSLWKGAFSYSSCNEYNSGGEYRFRHCVVAAAHELGHSVVGCLHEPGPNVMHADALMEQSKVEGTGRLLPIGPECLKKVKSFIRF